MMKQRAMMFILLLCSILLGVTHEAIADSCTAINNIFAMPSTLVIPRDLPVGAQIGSTIYTGTYTTFSDCIKTSTGWMNVGIGTNSTYVQSISNARLYATGIPGISYALMASTEGSSFGTIGSTAGYQGDANKRNMRSSNGIWTNVTMIYGIAFYKTAATTGSGTVGSLEAGYTFSYFDDSGFITPNANLTITGLTAQTTACSVSNSVINVALPTAKSTDFGFGDVGSNTGSTAFNIGLSNCDAGLNVSMILSAGNAGSSDKSLGLLTADSTSSGSGLALQLMYNNAPVTLDTAFSVLGSATTSGGSYQIPLAVRYYKTAASIKSGTINSCATFTMIYN